MGEGSSRGNKADAEEELIDLMMRWFENPGMNLRKHRDICRHADARKAAEKTTKLRMLITEKQL